MMIMIQNIILVIDNGQAKVYIYIDGWRFYLNWLSDTHNNYFSPIWFKCVSIEDVR